jgi:hypothetical protein
MKTKKTLQPTQKSIPDGEGFNALPIAFDSPHPCTPLPPGEGLEVRETER